MKKSRAPKKPSEAVQNAQYRLNHAVVRGEPDDVIDRLRSELNEISENEKFLKQCKIDTKKTGISRLGPISDAIKNFR